MTDGPGHDDPDIEDALDDLEELETMVDSRAEREQVQEAMRTLERVVDVRIRVRVREPSASGAGRFRIRRPPRSGVGFPAHA